MNLTLRFWRDLALCLLLLLAFAPANAPAQANRITVTKNPGTQNPGLYVAEFSGTPEQRTLLLSTLKRCGWFELRGTAAGATYVIKARQAGSALTMEVSGAQTLSIRQSSSSRAPERLTYEAVDQLISKLFKNPGPCASPIAFVNGSLGYKEVFTCNFDGTGFKQLTHNRSISTEPSWGPRGALLYTMYQNRYTDVVLVDTLSRQQRRLSSFPGLNSSAAFSADGRFVALTLSRDRAVELYIMSVSTKALRRLTTDRAVESSPTWSPDSRQLCYVSDVMRGPKLFTIPVGGGRARKLCSLAGEQVSPDWSHVSNKIVFAVGGGKAGYNLAVIDMNGSSQTAETITRGGLYEAPSWAPDGRHIVCTRTSGGKRELVMVDSWLKTVTPVTRAGDISLPSWAP